MLELTFTVEAEPVPAPRPRVTKRGVYYHKRYTDWLSQVRVAAVGLHSYNLHRPVSVCMHFYTARCHRMDVDNLAKGVMDALTGIVWDNDNVVHSLLTCKSLPTRQHPVGVVVKIRKESHSERSLT